MNTEVAQAIKDIISPLLESSAKVMTTNIESIKDDMREVKSDIKALSTSLSDMQTKVGVLQSSLATMKEDVGTLKTTVSDTNQQVSELTTSITTASTEMENLSEQYKKDHEKVFGTDGISEKVNTMSVEGRSKSATWAVVGAIILGTVSVITCIIEARQAMDAAKQAEDLSYRLSQVEAILPNTHTPIKRD